MTKTSDWSGKMCWKVWISWRIWRQEWFVGSRTGRFNPDFHQNWYFKQQELMLNQKSFLAKWRVEAVESKPRLTSQDFSPDFSQWILLTPLQFGPGYGSGSACRQGHAYLGFHGVMGYTTYLGGAGQGLLMCTMGITSISWDITPTVLTK